MKYRMVYHVTSFSHWSFTTMEFLLIKVNYLLKWMCSEIYNMYKKYVLSKFRRYTKEWVKKKWLTYHVKLTTSNILMNIFIKHEMYAVIIYYIKFDIPPFFMFINPSWISTQAPYLEVLVYLFLSKPQLISLVDVTVWISCEYLYCSIFPLVLPSFISSSFPPCVTDSKGLLKSLSPSQLPCLSSKLSAFLAGALYLIFFKLQNRYVL